MAGGLSTGQLLAGMTRMRVAVLRHTLRGARLEQLSWGLLFGLAAIVATVWVAAADFSVAGMRGDLLALLLCLWALGWALGPVLFTGEDRTLRPEWFRTLPAAPWQLAVALLGSAFAGAPVAVSALAFTSLVVYAAPLGALPTVVAVVALPLTLLLVILLSRVVTGVLRALIRSQLSAALSAVVTGAVMAFFVSGWLLVVPAGDLLGDGMPATVAGTVRATPPAWGVVAVDAASDGRWGLAAGALAGLLGLVALLGWAWSGLLTRRMTTRLSRSSRRSAESLSGAVWQRPLGAVVRKELLAWSRDYTRSSFLYFAFFYSLFMGLYPALAGQSFPLLFTGVLFAVTAAGSTANLYGVDGSALWLMLTTPGPAARVDIRGRQLAWLLVVGPIALIVTIVAVMWTGQTWAFPAALALTVAVLGAGSGLLAAYSVLQPHPLTDPHLRGDDMFDHNISWLQFMSLIIGVSVLAAPAGVVGWQGLRDGSTVVQWLGVLVAVATATLWHWAFGALAHRRLASIGPELLSLLRHGPAQPAGDGASSANQVIASMTPAETALLYICGMAGVIALFPQGVVPVIFKLTGQTEKVWFLALHLPGPWQWPIIAVMVAVGVLCLSAAARVYQTARRRGGPATA